MNSETPDWKQLKTAWNGLTDIHLEMALVLLVTSLGVSMRAQGIQRGDEVRLVSMYRSVNEIVQVAMNALLITRHQVKGIAPYRDLFDALRREARDSETESYLKTAFHFAIERA
jgi:hypothetical protein